MIEIGQDALGAWGWMVVDRLGTMVASGDNLPDRFLAIDVAIGVYRAMLIRGVADLDRAICINFPDEAAQERPVAMKLAA